MRPPPSCAAAERERVVSVEHPAVAEYTADGYVLAFAALIEQEQPALVFLPHTYQTRDFAPALAARLGRALIPDVTASGKTATARSMSGRCSRAS